ncbi:hypothetical protein GCM10010277_85490 [Streptomyces longisporoflavus]|uniref:DUF1929 domain-containing protein n=1 Tax=Streptomyces longisporoflavus TaxID=28044 RepID=UPI00199816E9|nr:DUF1929 domain-containing protein [Streptomyces longisporoflavus]GGV72471.1 hypothetical protein GCM10010277_85490 [Streptomyces longisporoflavus]
MPGARQALHTPDAARIQQGHLMRPGSATHNTDFDQRSIALDITRRDRGGPSVSVPDNHALVPSGWYMFFATDREGVPSQTAWVHVRQAARRRVLRLRARLPPAGTSAPPPPCTRPRTRWRERPAKVLP